MALSHGVLPQLDLQLALSPMGLIQVKPLAMGFLPYTFAIMCTLRLGLLFTNKTFLVAVCLWCLNTLWNLKLQLPAGLQLEFDIYFLSQAAHVWTLHPTVYVLSLVLAFDFDTLLFNIHFPSGYLGPLDGVQGSNS
jgi:hypothetical protein